MKYMFKPGRAYTRKDVFGMIGIEDPGGGNWYTGYTSFNDDWFLFCGVGTPGRTGHDYHNHFRGEDLVWFGKTKTRLNQPAMKEMLRGGQDVYVFYRESNREAFVFAGL